LYVGKISCGMTTKTVGRRNKRASLKDLASYREAYVTIAELAKYWCVSRKQLYKQIEAGTLRAIRLGPRLLRVRTADAREFERQAHMEPPDDTFNNDHPFPAEPAVAGDRARRR
jgi:excisionase family DNA binding protein